MRTINTIWCVGRNYQEHINELKNETPEAPLIFTKANTTIVPNGQSFPLPSWSSDIQHEVELGLILDESLEVSHICVALDLTARDKQAELKKKGSPWTLAKSFKNSCPLGEMISLDDFKTQVLEGTIALKVNGVIKQQGQFKNMIFSISELLSYLKEHFPLSPGDLILTGTPAGVGQIHKGDYLEAYLNGELKGNWKVLN